MRSMKLLIENEVTVNEQHHAICMVLAKMLTQVYTQSAAKLKSTYKFWN
jgi:hypothetical protein